MRGAVLVLSVLPLAAGAQEVNDYPTSTRAEYVVTCMAVNGQTQDMLTRCSCAIDQIASVLPYKKYVEAETVMRMQQTTGERAGFFKSSPLMATMVADLRRAEAEADILCF